MENQDRTSAVKQIQPSPWLVSQSFDLCFLANLWWPVIVLGGWLASETESWFGFWQIYFLTTPHRWLTLLLVAADPDRRAGRTIWLVGIAVAVAIAISGIWLATGQLLCLALIDYLWNAWHFGSQHGGIARMYARRSGTRHSAPQTWALRLLVFYSALRVAGWSTGWLEVLPTGTWLLAGIDVAVIFVAALGVLPAFQHAVAGQDRGWRLYVASVVVLYATLLVAINVRMTVLVAALVAASAAVHAVEYLAIVTHYARRREHSGSRGLFSAMARQWTSLLLTYLVLLGALSQFADVRWQEAWLALNLGAAFLHYAYDGMIWKLRDRQTSSTLGVELPLTAEVRA